MGSPCWLPWPPPPSFQSTNKNSLKSLVLKTSISTKMFEPSSVTSAQRSLSHQLEEQWSINHRELPGTLRKDPMGEHDSLLEVRQQPVHHSRPHVQPHHVLHQVGCLRECWRVQCWSDERCLH